MVWTQQQADEDIIKTALQALNEAIKASPILATANMERQAAIADFVYNLGITNYNKSTLKLRVDKGNWVSASTEIKKWNKSNGTILNGLIKRRQLEADLLLM
jgi:lysozyme